MIQRNTPSYPISIFMAGEIAAAKDYAQGIEAATAAETTGSARKGDGPVAKPCAQKDKS